MSWTVASQGLPLNPLGAPDTITALATGSYPSVLYAGNANNPNVAPVFKSADGGATWFPCANGLTPGILVLTWSSYAATSAGVFSLDLRDLR